MQNHSLPFPRGTTYGDNVITMTATIARDHEGRVYEVPDSVHNTGRKVKLRVVRNLTGAAMTVARNFCEFSVGTQLDFGRKISGYGASVSQQGAIAKPLDDAYTVGMTIPNLDLFYVVEHGPATVLTETVVCNLAAGDAVTCDANGRVNGAAAAAGQYVVGTADRSAVVANENLVIHVNEGLDNEGA